MDTAQKKTNRNVILSNLPLFIAIASTITAAYVNNINSTCLAQIYEAFPDASMFLKSYIVNGPAMIAIPFMLLIGVIGNKVDLKKLLVADLFFVLLGGFGGAFAPSMIVYAIARTVAGISGSVMQAIINTIIFANYPVPEDSAKCIGLRSGISQAYAALISFLAGVICLTSWRYATMLNATIIIPIALVWIFLPSMKKKPVEKAETEAAAEVPADEKKVNAPCLVITLIEGFLNITMMMVPMFFISVYVAERGIGTSALAGLLTAMITLGGVAGNLILGKIYATLKRYTGIFVSMVAGLGMLALSFNAPVGLLVAIIFIIGIACAVSFGFYPIATNTYVPKSKSSFFQSLYCCILFGAMSACSFVPMLVISIFNCGYQMVFMYVGIVMLILAAAIFLTVKLYISKKEQD